MNYGKMISVPNGATFGGMKVIVSPFLEPRPKLSLSEHYAGTAEFRAAFNHWLVETFGYSEDRAIISGDTVIVSPRGFKKLMGMKESGANEKCETCTYPHCNCPFDAPADPDWCGTMPPLSNALAQADAACGVSPGAEGYA